MEEVDILQPPIFNKSDQTKPRKQAISDGDWIGAFNLWVVQTEPELAIVYQQRSPQSSWEPNKLDVSAGGSYSAGESMLDGLREAEEELGKKYDPTTVLSVGRRLNVSPDIRGLERKTVLDIFLVVDNDPLNTYVLEKKEVSGLTICPLEQLIKLHKGEINKFEVDLLTPDSKQEKFGVTKGSFPGNWDNYHYKMALLIQRFGEGETELIY